MKKLTYIFFLIGLFSFSQDKKWSFEASYPVTIDDNFVGRNYNGIADLGAKFRLIQTDILNFGFGLNTGILKGNNRVAEREGFEVDVNIMVYMIQPKAFLEFKIERTPEFHPFVYGGYSFLFFDANSDYGYDLAFGTQNLNGFNVGLGFSYDITDKFFAQIQYDFTKIQDKDILDIKYNTNINILKIGVGFRI